MFKLIVPETEKQQSIEAPVVVHSAEHIVSSQVIMSAAVLLIMINKKVEIHVFISVSLM